MQGEKITYKDGMIQVPNNPIIPFIVGDGIGSDITKATQAIVNAAVSKSYNNEKEIAWHKVYAGEDAAEKYDGDYLPQETLDALVEYCVSIKGPLTTPVGKGFRSLNVGIRQKLNLFACVRPVRHFKGVPSPVKRPEALDITVFRENTEDVYAGIEWQQGTDDVKKVINFLNETMKTNLDVDNTGIGIKPISIKATEQITEQAIQFAITNKKKSVTFVHKGNIMKYTEGAFKDWGYAYIKENYADQTITEDEVYEKHDGVAPEGKIVIQDRIADSMLQQILLRPDTYDVLVLPNLNGDYISDAAAAQVGGLGIAPGANIGDKVAVFEATHGTAPKYANKDMVNPSSLVLSAVMMLEHMGWSKASTAIVDALEKCFVEKQVTYDLARQIDGANKLSTSAFAAAVIENL